MGVLANRVKTHAAAEFLEECVIGVRHRFDQVHVAARRHANHGVAADHTLLQRGQGNRRFDGGARNIAGRKRELLIDNGEDAPVLWIDRDDRPVVASKSADRGGGDDRIVILRYIIECRIRKSGDAVEPMRKYPGGGWS